MAVLWELEVHTTFLLILLGFLVALEVGFRIGLRRSDGSEESEKAHISAMHAAVLGLLALLLGFSFLMAVSRFEQRKELVRDEANAIGTTYLRAKMLPEAERSQAPALLRAYVATRLDLEPARADLALIGAANAKAAQIETQLWALATSAAAQNPQSEPIGLFIESLNEVIDIREKRTVARENHVPDAVLWLLFAVSVAALGLIAYGCGLARRRRPFSNAVFALLIAVVLTMIIDVDKPRRGLIQVGLDATYRLKASLDQDAANVPPP